MDTSYPVKVQITLEPIGCPWVRVTAGDQTTSQKLVSVTDFNFEFEAAGSSSISVTHFDKPDNDASTAVVIKSISFFGIQNPKFIWQGQYRPIYPEPWFSSQSPSPEPVLMGQDYLGWNGTWDLNFEVPVFTWMHKVLDFGWIYD